MKTFVIAGFGMGDVLATTPLLRNLQKIPQNEVFLFNESTKNPGSRGKDLLFGCPYVHRVISFERAAFREKQSLLFFYQRTVLGAIIDFFRLVRKLRRERFDVVIDSWPTTKKTAILSFLSGAKKRIGYAHNPLSFFYTHLIDEKGYTKPESDAIALSFLGVTVQKRDLSLEVFIPYARKKQRILNILAAQGIKEGDFIVCFNVGRDFDIIRGWPIQYWVTLGRFLQERYHAKIMFLGDTQSMRIASDVANQLFEKGSDLTGKLRVEETLAALSLCRLMISINNGLMHMGVACRVPMVVISTTSLRGWDPYASNARVVRVDTPQMCTANFERHMQKEDVPWDVSARKITVKKVLRAVALLRKKRT